MSVSPPRTTILVGGRWHAFDLAQGLQKRGALLRVVTNYPRSRLARWGIEPSECVFLPLSLALNQFNQRCVGARHRHRLQGLIHAVFERGAARHVGGASVVHGWSGFSRRGLRRAKAAGAVTVLERGSSHMLVQNRLLADERARTGVAGETTHAAVVACELEEYAEADAVQVPSSFVEGTFLEQKFPAARLHKNFLGVNLAQFSPADAPPPGTPFRVVFAGGLTFRKGIHDLVAAFREAAIPESELVLLGGASEETPRLIGTPPAGLRLLGHRPQAELVEHYRTAHVFVHASIEEGMAMVQAQALATGLPLVCTAHTGGEDLLRTIGGGATPAEEGGVLRYTAGFVTPVRDPSAIARCLARLHGDPALLASMRTAALRIRGLELDWQAYADRTLALYERLLAARRP